MAVATSGSVIGVGVRVYLKDDFSKGSARIRRTISGLRQEMNAWRDNLQNSTRSAGVTALAGGMMLRTISGWVQEGAKFDYIMRGVGASTGASADQMRNLSDQALAVGRSTAFSPMETAEGMRQLALAGQEVADIYKTIGPAASMARASMVALTGEGGGAEILVNIMRHFDIPFDKAAQTADKLTIAGIKSSLSLSELAESLKYSASTAMDLGVGLDQTTAVMMTVANAGIKGSMAGVGFENMLRYLARALGEYDPKKKAGKAMSAIGLMPKDMVDAAGNLRPVGDMIGVLAEKLEGMGDIQKQNILYDIFQVRGKRQASLLLRNLAEYKKNLVTVQHAQGKAGDISDKMLGGLEGSIMRLKNMWIEFKATFAEALAPILVPVLNVLKGVLKVINWIMGSSLGKWIVGLTVLVLAWGTAMQGIRWVVGSLYLAHHTLAMGASSALTSMKSMWNNLTASAIKYMAVVNMANGGTKIAANGRMYTTATATGAARFLTKAQIAGSMGAGAGLMALGSGGGAIAKGLGARALGFLGGPVGTALMIIGTFLPVLISAFSGNSSATEKNTDAIKGSEEEQKARAEVDRMFMAKVLNSPGSQDNFRKLYSHSGNNDSSLERAFRLYMSNPNWRGNNTPFFDFRKKGEMAVYINGVFNTKAEINHEREKKYKLLY